MEPLFRHKTQPDFQGDTAPNDCCGSKLSNTLPQRIIGIGGAVTRSPLPHHRTCGSAYGGSVGLSYPANKRGSASESK
jgi:hypothetical protein